VLPTAPEAADGGPLAYVENGSRIRVSVKERRRDLLVDEATMAARRVAKPAKAPAPERGWAQLYQEHVLQADEGCDLDFLRARGAR